VCKPRRKLDVYNFSHADRNKISLVTFWIHDKWSLSPQHDASSDFRWRNGLQMWKVASNILNKQSRTANKGWSSSFGVGELLTTHHRINLRCYGTFHKASDIEIGNKSFERVGHFKYLAETLTNKNSVQEEIKSRLKSGNACIIRCRIFCLPVFHPKI
jgi:hypothetical protein